MTLAEILLRAGLTTAVIGAPFLFFYLVLGENSENHKRNFFVGTWSAALALASLQMAALAYLWGF